MPLHTHDKPVRWHTDAFDQAILGNRHRLKIRRQLFDCLMVIAVHSDLFLTQNVVEQRVLLQRDLMCHPVVWRLHVMVDTAGMLRRQILIQGPAVAGVHKLEAPAYTQNRFIALYGSV